MASEKGFRMAAPKWQSVNAMDMRSILMVNPNEARIVYWIFEKYLAGNSLGKIAAGLERQGIPSPGSD